MACPGTLNRQCTRALHIPTSRPTAFPLVMEQTKLFLVLAAADLVVLRLYQKKVLEFPYKNLWSYLQIKIKAACLCRALLWGPVLSIQRAHQPVVNTSHVPFCKQKVVSAAILDLQVLILAQLDGGLLWGLCTSDNNFMMILVTERSMSWLLPAVKSLIDNSVVGMQSIKMSLSLSLFFFLGTLPFSHT